jgi:hypothetical protein
MQKKYVIISLVALGLSTAAFVYYMKQKRKNEALENRVNDLVKQFGTITL